MSLAADWMRRLGAPFDPRGEREVREDIEAELAFHLDSRERELVANGMTPEAAREEARRRFGDVARIGAECRRVRIGGAFMSKKSSLVLLGILVAVVVLLGVRSIESQRASRAEIHALQAQIAQLQRAMQRSEAEAGRAPAAEVAPGTTDDPSGK